MPYCVAADQYAVDWLKAMREKGYDNVRIEPALRCDSRFSPER
jgi:hypothetical protein